MKKNATSTCKTYIYVRAKTQHKDKPPNEWCTEVHVKAYSYISLKNT